jgi:hypothetical protein
MLSAVPAGDVHDLLLWRLIAVVASLDLNARAIELGKARRQAQALGSSRGREAVECRHPVSREAISGPTEGIIVELVEGHTR